jgi:signal transduction histidine kinase
MGQSETPGKKSYRLGLTGKFVIQVIWIIIAVGIIFTWIPIKEERQVREEGLINLGEALVNRWIQRTVQDAFLDLYVRDPVTLKALISDLGREENVAYVILIDGFGREIAHAGDPPAFPGTFRADYSADKTSHQSFMTTGGREFIEISAPVITAGAGIEGGDELDETLEAVSSPEDRSPRNDIIVRAGFDKDKIEQSMAESRRKKVLLTMGIMIPALSLLVFIFIRNITSPLKEVTQTVRFIARGDLHKAEDLNIITRDEVGDLADDVKLMANKLQLSRDALEKLNIELEKKVEERTGDLTKANEELEKANIKLKELDQLKSEFLSTVSHELRTPLTSIKAFSEILLDKKGGDPDTQQRFLNIINNQSERLTRLIGDLLNLSRIESGKRGWKKEKLDTSRIVEEAVRELSSLSNQKQIEIESRWHSAVPDLYGSFDKLIEVVTNILNNALKFSDTGSRITLSVFAAGDPGGAQILETPEAAEAPYVLMKIQDRGIGIPGDCLDKIFERFYQVDPRKAKEMGGSGLGLAICKEIIENHGGNIWVESREGEGSTFFITISSVYHGSRTGPERDESS